MRREIVHGVVRAGKCRGFFVCGNITITIEKTVIDKVALSGGSLSSVHFLLISPEILTATPVSGRKREGFIAWESLGSMGRAVSRVHLLRESSFFRRRGKESCLE
jgi:hypothetical protein